MNEQEIREMLQEAICCADEEDAITEDMMPERMCSFEEAGVLTRDTGLVLTLPDGSEFQVTIQQSRDARS